jgi:DNA-3-methyladenine glycosylase
MLIDNSFFAREPLVVAKDLLGKVLRHSYNGIWLSAMIIETEAYYLGDKGSHSSLGFTQKRKALFMEPGTIYMYYARGGDSLNISCLGEGNAVLLKSGFAYTLDANPEMINTMLKLNPIKTSNRLRAIEKLCSGQTLLCRSLGLKVPTWNQKSFHPDQIRIEDLGYRPKKIIQTKRLGIPIGRDEHLLYRFIDFQYVKFCTSNPLTKRDWQPEIDYLIHEQ